MDEGSGCMEREVLRLAESGFEDNADRAWPGTGRKGSIQACARPAARRRPLKVVRGGKSEGLEGVCHLVLPH